MRGQGGRGSGRQAARLAQTHWQSSAFLPGARPPLRRGLPGTRECTASVRSRAGKRGRGGGRRRLGCPPVSHARARTVARAQKGRRVHGSRWAEGRGDAEVGLVSLGRRPGDSQCAQPSFVPPRPTCGGRRCDWRAAGGPRTMLALLGATTLMLVAGAPWVLPAASGERWRSLGLGLGARLDNGSVGNLGPGRDRGPLWETSGCPWSQRSH